MEIAKSVFRWVVAITYLAAQITMIISGVLTITSSDGMFTGQTFGFLLGFSIWGWANCLGSMIIGSCERWKRKYVNPEDTNIQKYTFKFGLIYTILFCWCAKIWLRSGASLDNHFWVVAVTTNAALFFPFVDSFYVKSASQLNLILSGASSSSMTSDFQDN